MAAKEHAPLTLSADEGFHWLTGIYDLLLEELS
jgi:hypothetical protein